MYLCDENNMFCDYKCPDDMNIEPILHQKTFRELTTDELYELLRVRSEVFVVEQNCVYQDMDGDDQKSIHLWLTVADKIVALARVCPAGTHMILCAKSVGVDSCWVNFFDPDKMAEAFQLPANEEILTCLALGYPAEGAGPLANHNSRKPIEETVTYL